MKKFDVGVTIEIDMPQKHVEAEDIHDACAQAEHEAQQEFEEKLGDDKFLRALKAHGGSITVHSYPS